MQLGKKEVIERFEKWNVQESYVSDGQETERWLYFGYFLDVAQCIQER